MKKLLTYGMAIMTIVWSLSLAVNVSTASAAYAPTVGDLIKTANDSAVYYIDTGNKRRLYVNAVTFWTWNTGTWSNIKNTNGVTKTIQIISQTDFDNLTMGLNITARPGARIIKFQNSPKIYTVSATAQLALIPDTATAKLMFGDSWSAKVVVIQNGFENDYTKDGVLDLTANWQTYANDNYSFEFTYPITWKLVKTEQASSIDYLPSSRNFVAVYPDSYPAQDFSARVDIYNVPLATVKSDNSFLKNLTPSVQIINGISWVKMGDANYLVENNGKTYDVSGRGDLINQIT